MCVCVAEYIEAEEVEKTPPLTQLTALHGEMRGHDNVNGLRVKIAETHCETKGNLIHTEKGKVLLRVSKRSQNRRSQLLCIIC